MDEMMKTQEGIFSNTQRLATVCFLVIFGISLTITILPSFGFEKAENYVYWESTLKTLVGPMLTLVIAAVRGLGRGDVDPVGGEVQDDAFGLGLYRNGCYCGICGAVND